MRGSLVGGLPASSRLTVVALVVMLAAGFVPHVVGDAWAGTQRERIAKLLLKRDPGKRVDGETRVGTAAGAVIRGVRGRINFMMALADREGADCGHKPRRARRLRRDARCAHLRWRGPDLIHGMGLRQQLVGGAGNDLIYGGPGRDTIYGGPGSDTIMAGRATTRSTAAAATIDSSITVAPRPSSPGPDAPWWTSEMGKATTAWCAERAGGLRFERTGAIGCRARAIA